MQNSDAGNSAIQSPSQNSNPATASKVVQKRRSQNPPELQEASKHMNVAFSTLNRVLQSKKHQEDKENDDAGLFCQLLAKQLRDFPKEERDELMYEIHGLIINKRRRSSGRVLQPIISSPIYSRSSSAHGSYYSNDSLPRNISPSSHIIQQPSLYSDTSPQIIINRPSSRSSHTRPTTQEISHQTLPVDQQSSQYYYQQQTTNRPSSSQSFHQEILHESQYVPRKVQVISQEIVRPGSTDILLEAFENACTEQE